ncbi:MAG TPA: glucosyl-3-phosphoglycerate synthase, partial [Acidobacteriota bacterium]|nr:glucosyl-3-phosphoglycerate synthase [Acidobacteriota bacterium]
LVVIGMVVVPEETSLSTGAGKAQELRSFLGNLRDAFGAKDLYRKPRIRVVHEPWSELMQTVAKEGAHMLLVPWDEPDRSFSAVQLDEVLGRFPCHVIILRGRIPAKPKKILMPLRGSEEAPLTLQLALSLASGEGEITMLYSEHDDPSPTSQRVYREVARMSQGNPSIGKELRVEGKLLAAISEQAERHDLIVIGASEADPGTDGDERTIGTIPRELRRQGVSPIAIVKTHGPAPLRQLSSWNPEEFLPVTPTYVVVDKWFGENTFHSREFEDLARTVRLKERRGLTISLGLPALNEEKTVGKVIQTVRKSLVEEFPLLDELVLIDSGSTDRTVEIARDLGVPVYIHSEILPDLGTYKGKGEGLWKSLFVLKGDLVAWIDTDISNIDPRFVYGTIGPLVHHEKIQYVKGFYRRPLKVAESMQAAGGGRVTELVARPMINLFYPELSGLIQPLSGEYAGRRRALERLPFYSGYGVETGLLLALVERFGITGIAQVDLGRKVHHNQSLEALSRMAFAIIQVFVDHLESRQKVNLLTEINRTMKIIQRNGDSYRLKERAIHDQKRPPMISIPAYRERFGIETAEEDEPMLVSADEVRT